MFNHPEPGDMAVVVFPHSEIFPAGTVVECVRWVGASHKLYKLDVNQQSNDRKNIMETSTEAAIGKTRGFLCVPVEWLMKISPDDETRSESEPSKERTDA